jgi:hypothetical protein
VKSQEPMHSHLPAMKSQATRVISHPFVISQGLRNHTPCDFTPGMCEITQPPVKTHPSVRFHTAHEIAGGTYEFIGPCENTRPAKSYPL